MSRRQIPQLAAFFGLVLTLLGLASSQAPNRGGQTDAPCVCEQSVHLLLGATGDRPQDCDCHNRPGAEEPSPAAAQSFFRFRSTGSHNLTPGLAMVAGAPFRRSRTDPAPGGRTPRQATVGAAPPPWLASSCQLLL